MQQPDSIPWTYGQYPPSPDYHATTPVTVNTPDSISRYLPHSAPPQITPWSQYSHQLRYQYPSHQTQQHFNHLHDQSHLPFSGSANAPAPKKSALKRSHSHSAAVERSTALGSRPRTPRIHHDSSSESDLNTGFFGTDWSVGLAPAMYPTMIPMSAPVIPLLHSYFPGYALRDQEAWSLDNLSPRPRDWRADYVPKQGISLYLPRIGRVRSDVEGLILFSPYVKGFH